MQAERTHCAGSEACRQAGRTHCRHMYSRLSSRDADAWLSNRLRRTSHASPADRHQRTHRSAGAACPQHHPAAGRGSSCQAAGVSKRERARSQRSAAHQLRPPPRHSPSPSRCQPPQPRQPRHLSCLRASRSTPHGAGACGGQGGGRGRSPAAGPPAEHACSPPPFRDWRPSLLVMVGPTRPRFCGRQSPWKPAAWGLDGESFAARRRLLGGGSARGSACSTRDGDALTTAHGGAGLPCHAQEQQASVPLVACRRCLLGSPASGGRAHLLARPGA